MNYKKILSLLLAASMAVSMPINVFAVQPVTETENQTEVEPYIADGEAPVLKGVTISDTEVNAGESLTVTIDAEDKDSGINDFKVIFVNETNGRRIESDFGHADNGLTTQINVSSYETNGKFELKYVYITDKAGNSVYYGEEAPGMDVRPFPGEKPFFEVVNGTLGDIEAPVLKGATISDTEVNAGESLTVTIDAEDKDSGINDFKVIFVNETNGRRIESDFGHADNGLTTQINVSSYETNGKFELKYVYITDKAGNSVYYGEEAPGMDVRPFPGEKPFFEVVNGTLGDIEAPVLKGATISDTEVNAGESLTITIDAEDKDSGIKTFQAYFLNKENNRTIISDFSSLQDILTANMIVSKYEPTGIFELERIYIIDNAGNSRVYENKPVGGGNEALPNNLSFTVINDDYVPTPTPDPTPSNPDKGTSSNSSSSSSSAVNYESEKPNPADKKAVEAYNFWQNAKAKVRTTPDGKTMRLFVPKDITYMPASMMETLYREKITLIITHNGKKIVIPAGKAMPKQKLKVYWTFESLEKLYQA